MGDEITITGDAELRSVKFEIEPLEERLAPSTMSFGWENQGSWVQTDNGLIFLGHDPV